MKKRDQSNVYLFFFLIPPIINGKIRKIRDWITVHFINELFILNFPPFLPPFPFWNQTINQHIKELIYMEHYHTCPCGATISWTSQDVWLLKTGAYIDLTNNSSYAESNHRGKIANQNTLQHYIFTFYKWSKDAFKYIYS